MSKRPTFRPYQVAQLQTIGEHVGTAVNRLLIKSPTGTGKTVMFAGLLEQPSVRRWLETFPAHERRMLVIAHREELLDQAADKITAANPDKIVMIEQGDRRASPYADVVVASIQTLAARNYTRLNRLLARMKFRIVIVDEAHHSAAATYRTTLALLGFLPLSDMSTEDNIEAATHDDIDEMTKALAGWDEQAPRDRVLVGVTATPNRSDAIGLGCVFQSLAYSYDLKQAIADGWLVPPTPWVVQSKVSLDSIRTTAGDYNQKQLAEAVNNELRNQQAIAAWHEHAAGLSTLAFTVDVAHAHAVADAFVKSGVRAQAISGETPKEDRRNYLRQYTEGQIDVLSNCMVLTEGTDLPRTGCIVHLKPTQSATLYEQMTGRGLRLFEGKKECIVIDVVDLSRKHSLLTAPVLYGLPPGIKANGEDLTKVAADLEELKAKYSNFDLEAALASGAMTLEELRAEAIKVDPFAVLELGAFGNGRALTWVRISKDVFRLQYPWQEGNEILEVMPDLIGKWSVSATFRPYSKGAPSRQRTLAMGVLTADEAAGIAERFVLQERRSVAAMKNNNAGWRQNAPSPKAIGLLRKLGAQYDPKRLPNAGAVSDLIDTLKAKRGWK